MKQIDKLYKSYTRLRTMLTLYRIRTALRRHKNHSVQSFCSLIRTVILARFLHGAKLRRANLESGSSHLGQDLCHTLVQCEQALKVNKNINGNVNWNLVRRKQIIFSGQDQDLVHQTLFANRSDAMSDLSEQVFPVCGKTFIVILYRKHENLSVAV